MTRSRHITVLGRILQGEADLELAINLLNSEGCVTSRKLKIGEILDPGKVESYISTQPLRNANSPLPLKTTPVGAEPLASVGGGMVITSGTIEPVPVYRVETPVPLSAIHTGDPELKATPTH